MAIDVRRAIVRASSLIACEPFQSTETGRTYFTGASIQQRPQGTIIVATDGHTLVAMRETQGFTSGLSGIWRCQAKKRLSSLLADVRREIQPFPDSDLWVDLRYEQPGKATMTAVVAETAQQVVDGAGLTKLTIVDPDIFVPGAYPDFGPVLRKQPGPATPEPAWSGPFTLQTAYLQRAAVLAKVLGSTAPASVCFGAVSGEQAVTVTITGSPDVVCIFMPLKNPVAEVPPLVPAWLTDLEDEPTPDSVALPEREAIAA